MATPLRRDHESAAFFDGTAHGQLLIQRTRDGHFLGPEARTDPADTTAPLESVPAAGAGRLISWIVTRARPDATGEQAIVGIAGLVELDEGPWIEAPILDVDPSILEAGFRVVVDFPPVEDGEVMPAFRAATA